MCASLRGVHLIGMYFTGVHPMGVHFTSVHLTGVHLIGMHLISVHLECVGGWVGFAILIFRKFRIVPKRPMSLRRNGVARAGRRSPW